MSEQERLEEMHQAGLRPGVTIRSYDFPTSNNYYIEGLLIKIAPHPVLRTPNHVWIFCTDARDICPTCGGKGRITGMESIFASKTCSQCNGEGSIVEEERLGRMYFPTIENMKIRGRDYGVHRHGLGPGFVLVGYKDYVPKGLNNPLQNLEWYYEDT